MSNVIIIDGQGIKDWKKLLEESNVYIALVTKDFCDDMLCVEQTMFAKTHNIPTIVLWHKGVSLSIPDIFDGMNIRKILYFDEENKHEIKKGLEEAIKIIHLERQPK